MKRSHPTLTLIWALLLGLSGPGGSALAQERAEHPTASATPAPHQAVRVEADANADRSEAAAREEQRRRARNAKIWERATPEQRARYRALHRRLNELDPAKRAEFLERFRDLSAEDRERVVQRLARYSRASEDERETVRRRHRGLRRWTRFLPDETWREVRTLPPAERMERLREEFHALRVEFEQSLTDEERAELAQLDRGERSRRLEAFLAERYPERCDRKPRGSRKGFRRDRDDESRGGCDRDRARRIRQDFWRIRRTLQAMPPEEARQLVADPRADVATEVPDDVREKLGRIPKSIRARFLEQPPGGNRRPRK